MQARLAGGIVRFTATIALYDERPEKRAKGKNPVLHQAAGGEWRLTTAERKRILLNSIYGVDIDPQAPWR